MNQKKQQLSEQEGENLFQWAYSYILAEAEEDGIFDNRTDVEREHLEDVIETTVSLSLEFFERFATFNCDKIAQVNEKIQQEDFDSAHKIIFDEE
ncbi:MAG: hypothetical protein ACOCUH_01745 [Bacteriovoracia bacterium]